MFDAFRVGLGCCFIDTERTQERKNDDVPRSCFGGKRTALRREPERGMRPRIDETFASQSAHDPTHRHMRQTEAFGKSTNTRFDACIQEFGNRLTVILRGL